MRVALKHREHAPAGGRYPTGTCRSDLSAGVTMAETTNSTVVPRPFPLEHEPEA